MRRAVEEALRQKPGESDRAIAAHVGVGHPFVAKIRAQVESDSTCSTRTGKDGKQYPATNGKKPTAEPVVADEEAVVGHILIG